MIRSSALVRVRRAQLADAEALVRVCKESWRQAYRGLIPDLPLERMLSRRDLRWWQKAIRKDSNILVLDVSGTVAGYATFGAARSACAGGGEIYELYVAPVYQGLGFGEHLFEACRHQLDLRNLQQLTVFAIEGNDIAAAFYERRGGRACFIAIERFSGTNVAKVAYRWP